MDTTNSSEGDVERIAQNVLTLALIEQLASQGVMTLDQANQVFNRASDRLQQIAPGLAQSEEDRDELLGLAAAWRDYLLSKP